MAGFHDTLQALLSWETQFLADLCAWDVAHGTAMFEQAARSFDGPGVVLTTSYSGMGAPEAAFARLERAIAGTQGGG
eukprot:10638859-Prorocentrum_lima.AAC.1